jgi:phenylalanyl-tRNA synthetase beta chain
MKISLNWLADFLSPSPQHPLTPEAASHALTRAGLPVESIEVHGSDHVLDVEVTSNRGDCLSHLGVARELAALLNLPFNAPATPADPAATAPPEVAIRIDAPALCSHYTARVIRGVKIGPSPDWMMRRLEAVGIRPINNVVDVTNYVMFELGQPLHAFDFAKINGKQIIVRTAAKGESLVSIDARKRELDPSMLVIADAQKPVALAGVMGGLDTEVSAATVDVLLESARFDPLSIRRTARALAMKSDSSYRYERGIDPTLPPRASLRAAQLIMQSAGGSLDGGIASAGAESWHPKPITLRLARLKKILGVDLPAHEVAGAFRRIGLHPTLHPDRIEVTTVPHRLDISQEIDLVEEAVRVIGYDRIPTREEISIRLTPPDPDAVTTDLICQTLVAAGYFEAVTFSFVSDALTNDFGVSPLRAATTVRKADAHLRPSLLPGLLESVRFNETAGTPNAHLFEIGSRFELRDGQPVETRTVAAVGGDLREVRGAIEALLARLDSDRPLTVHPENRPGFAQGAAGKIVWGNEPIGYLGKIDRAVANKLSIREIPAAAELDLLPLLSGRKRVPQLKELPKFPPVRRDLSLIVPEEIRYEKIESLLQSQKLPYLEAVDFVTTYRGKPLEPNTKSVTVALVFRSPDATLTSEAVDASVQKATSAAKDQLGATLRA